MPSETPLLPESSADETAVGWGEIPEDPEDSADRLTSDRPPHWHE